MGTVDGHLSTRAPLRRRWLVGLGALALLTGVTTAARPAVAAGAGKITCEGFRGDPGDSEVYVMNADGSGLKYLTDNTVRDGDPTWSTDGKISFESNRDGSSEVWVMNADGSDPRQLTFTTGSENRGTTWSPGNTQIAFHSTRDGVTGLSPHGNFEIYRMNADGSGQTNLTNSPFMEAQPDWSPDGSKIVFNSNRDVDFEIYSINPDGSGLTRLTNSLQEDSGPVWSPDGTQIAFQSRRDGNHEIYRMNADGTGATRLTVNNAFDAFSDWSPDGTKIVFTSNRDGGDYEVYTMNAADGSDVRRLTTIGGFDGRCSWRTSPRSFP